MHAKKKALTETLAGIKNPQDRMAYLVERARRQPRLNPALKSEANKVEGCLANLWLVAEESEGRCRFHCDADSLIVRAVAGLLCEFYSGHAPAEILSTDPSFLAGLGITQ